MRSGSSLRARLLASAFSVGMLSAAFGAQAADQEFNIAPQSLDTALADFSRQSMIPVLATPNVTGSKRTSGVTGAVDAPTALAMLLQGTGLTYRQEGATFLIVKADQGPQGGSAAGDGAEVEALIVTAQKREEDIQDVPIAISAFTQEDLERSQIAGGPDLMTQVPNMTFTKTNFSSYSIQIRGIGTQAISATTDPGVAVAFNNTPFIRNRFFEQEFYDLQRVEVLRGPQGTLYGRNATAGVVNIISAKPSFSHEAKLSADIANFNSTRLEGMVNVPLVEDAVALRFAGAWTKREGYSTNEITGNPIDGRDLWSARVSLRVTPNERLDANLIWEHFEENDDRLRSGKQLCKQDDRTEIQGVPVQEIGFGGPPYYLLFNQGCLPTSLYGEEAFEAPNGYSLPYFRPLKSLGLPGADINPYLSLAQSRDLRVIESSVDPVYWAESDLVELQLNYDISDDLTLTSETGYNYDELYSQQDFNRFNTAPGAFDNPEDIQPPGARRPDLLQPGPNGGIFCDPQLGCADRVVAVDVSRARSRQFTQEFRIGSNFDGPFNFSLGANFLRYDTEDKYYVFINTLTLYAAQSWGAGQAGIDSFLLPPWQPGVSSNIECMRRGWQFPDAGVGQPVNGCQYIDPNPIESVDDTGHNYFVSKNPYKLISYAVFGEAYYNISDTLKVTAGLRWTVDKKEAPRIPSWLFAAETMGHSVAEVVEQEWREPTGRLTVDWKPELGFTDETLLYASYAHGYKAGGSNPPVSGKTFWGGVEFANGLIERSALKPKTFDAEFVDAFEVGAKNTLLDGSITLNLAAFYYDYKDYQISQIIDRSATNYNFDTEVWGLEIEADWRPLENLKLGFKGGYQNTRIGDGEQAIDIMDRTAGMPGWVVARPFPSYASNCIIPLYVGAVSGQLSGANYFGGGSQGPCEYAYILGLDPVTRDEYVANSIPGYAGFDPSTAPNNGEGFFKDLSGNELPNAPHYTATITADYTVPLPNEWLATLHTDLYYQSEAWTRVFNTEGFDKLKAFTNVNLAAIFTNDAAGWKVMAYVKNVFDKDNITGAFLNSDDTGLTTNVFLVEPRLYGLRVTKTWDGGAWWANSGRSGPYPLTVQLGGMLQGIDAPYDPITPAWADEMPDAINPTLPQNRDLDRDGAGELKLTWRPNGGDWRVSAGLRFGRNKSVDQFDGRAVGDTGCDFGASYYYSFDCSSGEYDVKAYDWLHAKVTNHEEHTIVDFDVGRDFGLGSRIKSSVGAGLRYADFQSSTRFEAQSVPDWELPEEWIALKYDTRHHFYDTDFTSAREFKGLGPKLTLETSVDLFGSDETGRLRGDASLTGGVLFGKQKYRTDGRETSLYYHDEKYIPTGPTARSWWTNADPPVVTMGPEARSNSATVTTFGAELGLSYEIQRFKVGGGYRWERYSDVLDAGYEERREVDRTVDGPYFRLSVGFGG